MATQTTFTKIIEQDYANCSYDVQFYIMEVDLKSFDPNSSEPPKVKYKIGITPTSIINFTIQESLADWIVKAEITIQSSLEDTYDSLTKGMPQIERKKLFTNDGNDILYVRIVPTEKKFNGENIQDWKLEYTFAIYDVIDVDSPVGLEDIPTSSGNKCKKLLLEDYKHRKLSTNNLLYSSYFPSENEAPNARPDGVKQTGMIIRDIFRLTGLGGALPPLVEDSNWDMGASKLFYTSPADASAADALQYIFAHHTSIMAKPVTFKAGELKSTLKAASGGTSQIFDFCILSDERTPNIPHIDVVQESQNMYLGMISLTPITKYFEKAGKDADSPGILQSEHFFVPDHLKDSNDLSSGTTIQPYRSPMDKTQKTSDRDYKLKGFCEISKYTLLDMSPDVNSTLFKSTPIISNDMATGEFKMELLSNRVETARRYISQNYIHNLYKGNSSQGAKEEDYFLINVDRSKGLLNMNPVFCLYGGQGEESIRQSYGIQNLLKMGIFLNQGINFRVPGLTLRTSGKFIGIDKYHGAEEGSSYDNKLLGQYLILDVKHIFEGTSYYNDITAVKIHNFFPTPKPDGAL